MKRVALLSCLALALASPTLAQNRQPKQYARLQDDKLVITPRDNGDRIVDFSHAGYAGANAPIPNVSAKVVVRLIDGDVTALIQAAIDQVGAMEADANGFRGAVLLAPGTFRVSGQIKLNRSGVVLRGSGIDQTTILATGYDRRALVRIAGVDDRTLDTAHAIDADYTPAGSTELKVEAGHDLKIGDTVLVTRPCTDEWIVAMGMSDFGGDRHGVRWNPHSRVLNWDRTITAVDGNTVTLDVPITGSLDARFGGGTIARYSFPGRIERVGIENLTLFSAHDETRSADEDHAWVAVAIDNARDAWVRRVCAEHFVSYAVAVFGNAARVTVEDCLSLAPTGEVGGWRRRAFYVEGQQVLMQRLFSEHALHDFAVGHVAAGPNAFVECESRGSLGASGAIDSWANGALFDRIRLDGGRIELKNLSYLRQGAGWSAAKSVIWNSAAGVIECWSPPMS
ncbi:MAG TPA: glycosyl hydrolase family 28-related protein, partial [Tepidisphaeraceae bacterium]|nr:glycosyl hydrolase family 28-related protein [Tepidisphaeraceae bacterium]